MQLPNYKDGSIVNLMSSIALALGGKTRYKQLKGLDVGKLSKAKNIVLIVIDGMGYEYLRQNGKNSIFWQSLRGKMTSVFPATTAAAITTFVTGEAPQQHGLTGWYMHLKEIGIVSTILRFMPRVKGATFDKMGIEPKQIFDTKPFIEKIKAAAYTITHDDIINSYYNSVLNKRAKKFGVRSLNGFFNAIKKALKLHNRRKFVYAYWGMLDHYGHEKGIGSKKALRHFRQIEKAARKFLGSINEDTAVIITADHGVVDTSAARRIIINNHPKLQECLALPLCGDARLAYCYVRPEKTRQFESYVRKKLKKYCWLYKSKELVKKGFFGLYSQHPKLMDRIGDYTLIMKGNYSIKDVLPGEEPPKHIGVHGGTSREEMIVPLIVVEGNRKI